MLSSRIDRDKAYFMQGDFSSAAVWGLGLVLPCNYVLKVGNFVLLWWSEPDPA